MKKGDYLTPAGVFTDVFDIKEYKIIDVKEGGWGIVYITTNSINPSHICALKTFKDEFMKDEMVVRRFYFEAQKWIELKRHDNLVYAYYIVRFNHFNGESGHVITDYLDKIYICLEFVKGNNLRHWIKNRMLDLPKSLEFALQFCTGMDFVRQTKFLIHRDIKPENCLITQDNILKITDWGLVKAFDDLQDVSTLNVSISPNSYSASLHLTQAGVVMGTPPYMSPEQCKGEKDLDIRSDIYSFGCMFYEMIAGSPPFECENFIEYVAHHLKVKPEPIHGISKELNAILMKCIEKKPDKRFTTFEELGNAISEVAQPHKRSKSISEKIKEYVNHTSSHEWILKGLGLFEWGVYNEAVKCFDQAIKLNPYDYETFCYKSMCLRRMDRHEEAITAYERVVEVIPGSGFAWNHLGKLYCDLGQFERGIEYLNRAIQIDPNNAIFRHTKANVLRKWGFSTKDYKKYEEAIECGDLGLKIDPGNYKLWMAKAICLTLMRRYKEAIQCFENAMNINPKVKEDGTIQCFMAMYEKKEKEGVNLMEDKFLPCIVDVIDEDNDGSYA